MNNISETQFEKEARFLRFVDETLRARDLYNVDEAFARKVFEYLENDPKFAAQDFVILIAHLLEEIIKTCGKVIDKDAYRQLKLAYLPDVFKVDQIIVGAKIWETDSMFEFYKEKLKDVAKIEYPHREIDPNSLIVSFTFTLPKLNFLQKFDVLHFLLCALNYMSVKNQALKYAVELFSDFRNELILEATREKEDSEIYRRALFANLYDVATERQWSVANLVLSKMQKVDSEKQPKPSEWFEIRRKNKEENDKKTELLLKEQKLIDAMPYIETIIKYLDEPKELEAYLSYFPNNDKISDAISIIRTEEPYKFILAEIESNTFMILLKYQVNILENFAQSIEEQENRNQQNEKQKDLVLSKQKEKDSKSKSYSPHILKQIIDTAIRLYEVKDKVKAIDIYTELHIEKNTYNKRIKYFGYDTPKILYEAREIIREREK